MNSQSLDLISLVYCDLGGIVRGRSLASAQLADDPQASVGWVPSAVARAPFGRVEDNPFGAIGDLRLLPDVDTHVTVPADERSSALEFVLCDLVETDGEPWDCCPRGVLRDALADLDAHLGACVLASFEHEFQLVMDGSPAPAMSLQAHRALDPFPARVMAALTSAGVEPERFVPESATHQFEVPVAPMEGMASADRSLALKEVVREVARRHELRVTFAPLLEPAGPGNGVHIHLSLVTSDGTPLFYDADRPFCLSELGGQFAAGIVAHASALSALTAPSPASYARLRPHVRSAAAAYLGYRDREALIRIPPVVTIAGASPAGQLRLEYRGADATANPYLALGGLIRAGLSGARQRSPTPPILDRDPGRLSPRDQDRLGMRALPATLQESLEALAHDTIIRGAMSPRLYETFVAVKRAELDAAHAADLPELCRRYAGVY